MDTKNITVIDRTSDQSVTVKFPSARAASQFVSELSAMWNAVPAASHPDPQAADGVALYTCKGKGGEYALIGTATGAGESRYQAVAVYRDVPTGALYFREPQDFDKRMVRIEVTAPQAAAEGVGSIGDVVYCPACHGHGESSMLDGGGPDACEIPCNCPHCNGNGDLESAYHGVVALLAAEHEKYMRVCAKSVFAGIDSRAAPERAEDENYAFALAKLNASNVRNDALDEAADAVQAAWGSAAATKIRALKDAAPERAAIPNKHSIAAKMPCGASVTNVYEAYEAGKRAAIQPAGEPLLYLSEQQLPLIGKGGYYFAYRAKPEGLFQFPVYAGTPAAPSSEASAPDSDGAFYEAVSRLADPVEHARVAAVLDAALSTPAYPHPKCDSACYYHCTEAGAHPPSCAAPERSGKLADDAVHFVLNSDGSAIREWLEVGEDRIQGFIDAGFVTHVFYTRPAPHSSNAAPSDAIVADWPACNPGCEYEDPHGGVQDCRSSTCSCDAAKASIARQRAALAAPAPTGGSVSVPEGHMLVGPGTVRVANGFDGFTKGQVAAAQRLGSLLVPAAGGTRHD